MRTLAIIGGYTYSQPAVPDKTHSNVAIHLYISSTLSFEADGMASELTQESNWPWDGKIEFKVKSKSKRVSISLRIPHWAENWTASLEVPYKDDLR